jgi:hypothetical protein
MAIFKAISADHSGRPGQRRMGTVIGSSGASGAFISCSGIGGAIIVVAGIGGDGGLVISGMTSWSEVSQLDDDIFPPSNC